jgi:hypothetical protein
MADTSHDARADEIKALCRDYAEEMIAVLVDVAHDPGSKGPARVLAARTMLERGFGAPDRKVEKTVDITLHDHRQAHLAALRQLADSRNPVNDIVEDADYDEIEKAAPASSAAPLPVRYRNRGDGRNDG